MLFFEAVEATRGADHSKKGHSPKGNARPSEPYRSLDPRQPLSFANVVTTGIDPTSGAASRPPVNAGIKTVEK